MTSRKKVLFMLRGLVVLLVLLSLFSSVFRTTERGLDLLCPFPVHLVRNPAASLRIEAADGTWLRVVPTGRGERALRVTVAEVSPHVVNALIAGEDRRFRCHTGVDFMAVVRAAVTNLMQGRVVSGASTLTQQVARLVEPRPRTWTSKVIEMFRARQLERILDKDEILEAYLNLAPFGGTLRGVESAALYWFGKHAVDLTPEEAAMLVAMLPAPTARAPHRAPICLTYFRNRVLDRMLREGALNPEDHARALAAPLGARQHAWPFLAPHPCDEVLKELPGGIPGNEIHLVRTALDIGLQNRVEAVVRSHDDAGVDGVAVVVVQRNSGAVRAMVGSRDYRLHPLNAARCRRAAGSTLKPLLFALAMGIGAVGPDSLVLDAPVAYGDYRPANFTEDFAGPMRVADALVQSRNVPAVRLLAVVGVDRFRNLLHRLGVRTPGRLHLDAALGTLAVSPLELARAYAALCRVRETDRVRDVGIDADARKGIVKILGRHSLAPARVRAATLAWKTGTSSGRRDAWSVGITPNRVAVVWLGNLDGRGAPDLVGGRSAATLLAAVVAVL